MVSHIEPLIFTTLDGVARPFRLTAREQVLIIQKNGLGIITEGVFEAMSKVLFECLVERGDLTLEDFQSILPPDDDLLIGFHAALKEHYNGPPAVRDANEKYRPRKAATTSSNGSTSQPSGGPTLVASESSGNSDSAKSEP